jgi:hypothetical protein
MVDLLNKLVALLGEGTRILCLGLGKPLGDRTAQIQLGLMLELASALKVGMVEMELIAGGIDGSV